MDLRLHRLLLALGAVLLLPDAVAACPICFGATESHLIDSARLGVLAMAGLTVCVLGVFGAWFVRLARLEASHGDQGPRFHHQEHKDHEGH